MSILSNHFPEILDELNGGPPEPAGRCCDPEITGRLCPACQQDYEAWLRTLENQLPLPQPPMPGEDDGEPCGQQFPDEEPPPF